jgi:hypothetical protein
MGQNFPEIPHAPQFDLINYTIFPKTPANPIEPFTNHSLHSQLPSKAFSYSNVDIELSDISLLGEFLDP